MDTVRVERHQARAGEIAEVVLDRPAAMNALDTATLRLLADVFAGLRADPGVVAVVLSSANPRAFCVGADLKERAGMSDAQIMEQRPVFRAAFGALLRAAAAGHRGGPRVRARRRLRAGAELRRDRRGRISRAWLA